MLVTRSTGSGGKRSLQPVMSSEAMMTEGNKFCGTFFLDSMGQAFGRGSAGARFSDRLSDKVPRSHSMEPQPQ